MQPLKIIFGGHLVWFLLVYFILFNSLFGYFVLSFVSFLKSWVDVFDVTKSKREVYIVSDALLGVSSGAGGVWPECGVRCEWRAAGGVARLGVCRRNSRRGAGAIISHTSILFFTLFSWQLYSLSALSDLPQSLDLFCP